MEITSIERSRFDEDDTLIVTAVSPTGKTEFRLSRQSQAQFLLALLATTPVQNGTKPHRFLSPIGLKISQTSLGRAGLVLYLTKDAAVHFALEKELVEALQERLDSLEWKRHTTQ